MTIRHLLSHTSGIGYSFTNPIEYALVNKTKKGEWELPLLDDPGREVDLLGQHARARASSSRRSPARPLEPWYQEHIFKPLGMIDTSWAVAASKQSRLAPQFTRANGKMDRCRRRRSPFRATAPFRGDGGLYSTAEDYSKFVRMLINGGTLGSAKILSPASVKLMGQNAMGSIFVQLQPDADKQRTKPFPLGAGKTRFGLGFQIAATIRRAKGFRSPGSMSWAGIFNTEFWVDPVKQVGGVQHDAAAALL